MYYERNKALAYAEAWAFRRNPRFYNFDNVGGDCTNFISQCIYEGVQVMNFTKDVGWYYISSDERSAAWSGVAYFYKFLTTNKSTGPYGHDAPLEDARPGDVIQLSFFEGVFSHSLLVINVGTHPDASNIRVATHTIDSYARPLDTYTYLTHRLIAIDGARK